MQTFLQLLSISKCSYFKNNLNFYRCVRSLARRSEGPKFVEGKIKTITRIDDSEHIESYKDFVKSVRRSKLGDELEIEKQFLSEDYHGDVLERSEQYYDMHLREQREQKSFIKKKIIGHKYFKLDKETNLLTHAAKEQIRFLHKSNPQEWNPKALSECFPISEAGVKRLLKCKFVQTCPEKIKAHDEDVAKKWEILKSGKISDKIYPLTQKLYREGKLVDDYFSGNPNLPTVSPPKKEVLKLAKKEEIGEYSAIVQTYSDYEKKKLLSGNAENSEKQLTVRNEKVVDEKERIDWKNIRKFASDELDEDDEVEVSTSHKRRNRKDGIEMPFSHFKETLKEETKLKSKLKYKNQYADYVVEQTRKIDKNVSKQPVDCEDYFIKISKYEKENIDAAYENNKKTIYKYDENLGYQYPVGNSIRGKLKLSKNIPKGKFVKKGRCVYDEDGEFLYKVP